MNYYEATIKVQKQKEAEKHLEEIRKAVDQLEHMLHAEGQPAGK
jgi:hypothetical protein